MGLERSIVQECPSIHFACNYIFCHYSLIANNIYTEEESVLLDNGPNFKESPTLKVSFIEQEQTSSCVAGRCFMGYLFF